MTIYAIGDSFTNPGYGASSSAKSYISLLNGMLGTTINNLGINGGATADLAANAYSINVIDGDKSIVELGTNDDWMYGADTAKRGYYYSAVQALIAWLALADKQKAINCGVAVGAWTNTSLYGIGKRTDTAGDTITFNVEGDVVYIGSIQYPGYTGNFSINVDGVDKGICYAHTENISTNQNMPCGPFLTRIPLQSNGLHRVTIKALGGGTCFIDWVAGSAQSIKLRVAVGNITRMTSGGYSTSTHGPSDATVKAFNLSLANAVAELIKDGLDVKLVDNNSAINTNLDLYSDGIHPNDSGHAKIAMDFYRALI
jgi:lysophospholipase L1-like esterase